PGAERAPGEAGGADQAQAGRGGGGKPPLGGGVSRRRGELRAAARGLAGRGSPEDGDTGPALASARDRHPPGPGSDPRRAVSGFAPRRARLARGPGGPPGGRSGIRPPGGAGLRADPQAHRPAPRAGRGGARAVHRRGQRDHARRRAPGEPARSGAADGPPAGPPGGALMDPLLEQLLAGFVDESQEIYERVARSLMELEKNPAQGASFDELARGLHALKGSAATLGLDELSDFAHRMEDVVLPLRGSSKPLPGPIADALLKSLDVWMARLRATASKGELPDLAPSLALLEKVKPSSAAPPSFPPPQKGGKKKNGKGSTEAPMAPVTRLPVPAHEP